MIIATAGHVDHGKTSLVRALTGVDTDRLAEEKKRGLTIELGFAYLPDAGHETIGFIDVPGHERFIRNALCGLAGADFVLFVIAADDGPMPQTREHLAIVDLMGLNHGAIALTKIDRVSPDELSMQQAALAELFAGTSLEAAPCFPVSAETGAGMSELKTHLHAEATRRQLPPATGRFRLAVDRTFHVSGAGLVATGTVFTGAINVGDAAHISGKDMEVRVRAIHAQNAQAETGRSGQRCALNLSGLELRKDDIARGDWIVADGVANPVAKFDAQLRVVKAAARDLAHWTPVHVHLGAAQTTGRVAVLEGSKLTPGDSALVQISLDTPIGAVAGDRFIIRDQSAQHTLGGGQVLDLFPPRRGRAKPGRIAWLKALTQPEHAAALQDLLLVADGGVDLGRFQTNRNLTDGELDRVRQQTTFIELKADGGAVAFSQDKWAALTDAVLSALRQRGEIQASAPPIRESEILSGTPFRFPATLTVAIARKLASDGKLTNDTLGVRLPTQRVTLEPADAGLWSDVEAVFADAGLRPLTLHDLADRSGLPVPRLKSFLSRASRLGLIVYISKTRISTPSALTELGTVAEKIARDAEDGAISVAAFRDRSDVGRNAAIEILEYFDRKRLTRRLGNSRELVQPASTALQFASS